MYLRFAYVWHVHRIRKRRPGEKIKVWFLVNEIAKWKARSLYDLMRDSGVYEPSIAVTFIDCDRRMPESEQRRKYQATMDFFRAKGCRVVDAFDWEDKLAIPADKFNADIVFYQQPWSLPDSQMPCAAAFKALTCYIPYYVANYGSIAWDCLHPLHKQLWRYFILSKTWEKFLARHCSIFRYAGRFVAAGHTALDGLVGKTAGETPADGYVIYAPHWSVAHDTVRYATFLSNGRFLLDYAKAHPEIKWVFKPHPHLKDALVRMAVWPESDVERYFAEWEKIAVSCYTSDYQELFLASRAMITDSASFLTEYFVTGKPLIHLVSSESHVTPLPPALKMLDSFYKARNMAELEELLKIVVEQRKDPMQEKRLAALDSMRLRDCNAAKNILEYLNGKLNVKLPTQA